MRLSGDYQEIINGIILSNLEIHLEKVVVRLLSVIFLLPHKSLDE